MQKQSGDCQQVLAFLLRPDESKQTLEILTSRLLKEEQRLTQEDEFAFQLSRLLRNQNTIKNKEKLCVTSTTRNVYWIKSIDENMESL